MSQGLIKTKEIYQDRGKRAREIKAEGRKIIGYFCCYPPVELMTALDLVPYRITGSLKDPLTKVDGYLETIMCPYVRSCFDLALKDKYDFLDGFVIPHTCDSLERIYDIWRHNVKMDYTHFINVPHMMHPASLEFFKKEIERFQSTLEGFAGKQISPQGLKDAIELHNQNRALLRKIYELRKPNPPLISGVEVLQLMVAGMCIPAKEYNELLREIINEVNDRTNQSTEKQARILVYGNEIDDIAFINLIEESGAKVVIDDLCTTTRPFWHDVKMSSDPIHDLAERYLMTTVCPRSYKAKYGTHQEDMENRFGYLKEYAKEYNVDGAIMYIVRFCDTHEFDAPDVKEYLESLGLRVLHIEDDYRVGNVGQLRTRIEAFLEIIS